MPSARYTTITAAIFLFLCQLAFPSFGQKGISFDIKKPKEFENRTLRSEKPQKKFTAPRRFIQNTITHYNYFFNANNKLNEVIERAKLAYKDDYSQLIPFYNYSLDVTAADSIELDSVAHKAQTGIVLHDLRSDWADNMYLLWGASYYLQKQFDSAYLMFQFINYAFATKEDDGYYRAIGSARDGNRATSISTKENNSLWRRTFSQPPSRNDAFIWQIKNHLELERFSEASSLILALKTDSLFPKRLHNDLEEMQAYLFYRQQMWDSTAAHLENALSNAGGKHEKARWEFLLGQLYERTNKYEQSLDYYEKSIAHTTDPIMDVYARLGSVRVNKDESQNTIDKNIATLIKMARRDKYTDYRDIIYYMAAQMELERDSTDAALALLYRSTKYATNNPAQRNKAFLQLADLSFAKRRYQSAYNFYDSLKLDDPELKNAEAIANRKSLLVKLLADVDIIKRQDSLQALARLPEDERKDLVKKLVRRLRKLQGLKDEGVATTTGSSLLPAQQTAPPLFADNSKKGEWYFYNTNLRQKGQTDFKLKWGTRPNTDNWRRSGSQNATVRTINNNDGLQGKNVASNTGTEETEVTFDGLYGKIPLTDSAMSKSQDSVSAALFTLGVTYIQEIEDCVSGTETLELLRTRFPGHAKIEEVLFNLYYCYNKNGATDNAAAVKKILTDNYHDSPFTAIVNTGKDPKNKNNNAATQTYENIYNQFIEGNFTDAIAQKKIADSTYGSNYWTPQLLYIEAVYYIKQREDSTAKIVLANIIRQFSGKPMADKATVMLDVLNRRKEIEEELRNLVIELPVEDSIGREPVIVVTENPVAITPPAKDSAIGKPVIQPPSVVVPKPTVDTVIAKPVQKPVPANVYSYNAELPHYVIVVLNKVDPIFVNEAKNAFFRYNRDIYYNKQMQAELVEVDADNRLLLISPFKNAEEAIAYVDKTRPKTSSEIIPWLTGGKYSYSIITESNLELLKNSKDIEKYKQFLEKNLPGKF